MRIINFNKYVMKTVMEDYALKDCSLVIDGHNYVYKSCNSSKLSFLMGLEANEYANYLRKNISIFKQAKVKLYVVFKGGDTDKNKKLRKFKQYVKKPLNNEQDPIFMMKDVWRQVLDEEGISYSICITEAKNDCVALANELGCSVLSNDIEYCFRNTPYIPSDTIKLDTNQCLINCKQYVLKNFLEKHVITENKAAIFAALSDENIIPNHVSLFKKWGVFSNNFIHRHRALLTWLSDNSENEIMAQASALLSIETYHRFVNYKDIVLKNIQNINPSLITEYLLNDRIMTVNRLDPLWFVKGVTMHNIPIEYINLYKNKLFIINTDVLDEKIIMFIDILIYAYNLLSNFEKSEISIYFAKSKNDVINCKTDNFNVTKPRYHCNVSVFENGWEDVNSLKMFDYFLTERNVNIDIIAKLPDQAKLLFITLVYYAQKKISDGINVTKEVYCLIISYVMLNVVFDTKESLTKEASGINENDSTEAIKSTIKYFKYTFDELTEIYDPILLRNLVEIQFCLVQLNNLNTLCGSPYETTKYHKTFNGPFVYKLFLQMRDYNENEFIMRLFETALSVQQYIRKLITTYKELV